MDDSTIMNDDVQAIADLNDDFSDFADETDLLTENESASDFYYFDEDEKDLDNSLNLYLKEIAQIPLLSKEDEFLYAKMVVRGRELQKVEEKLKKSLGYPPDISDLAKLSNFVPEEIKKIKRDLEIGMDKLVTSNLRLVISIAKKYKNKGLPLIDLIQEGNLGLIRAVEKFDPNKGFRFSTYATWWIRQSVTRGLSNQSRIIRLPLHIIESLQKIQKTVRKGAQEGSEKIESSVLEKETELSADKLKLILKASRTPLSIDAKIKADNDTYIKDLIPGLDESPEDFVIKESLKENIEGILSALDDKERKVILLRFGLEDGKQQSMQAIAEKFDITRERVRQIVNVALKKLRKSDKVKNLQNYLVN